MQTPNYKLSRWVRSNQAKLEDLNADNAKIDGALAGLAQMATELASSAGTITHLGNCAMKVTLTMVAM